MVRVNRVFCFINIAIVAVERFCLYSRRKVILEKFRFLPNHLFQGTYYCCSQLKTGKVCRKAAVETDDALPASQQVKERNDQDSRLIPSINHHSSQRQNACYGWHNSTRICSQATVFFSVDYFCILHQNKSTPACFFVRANFT